MDTRFWGSSGWQFLHILIELLPDKLSNSHQNIIKSFFHLLKDLLPCKYCRNSFNKYITSYPISGKTATRNDIANWLYVIHNKVNNKLRRQGYCTFANPSYSTVRELYINMANSVKSSESPITNLMSIGHNFLGSIIINYAAYCSGNPTY
jgi:hypothetical protein